MQARIRNPAMILPEALAPAQALAKVADPILPEKLRHLVHLRASQINGCAFCLELHTKMKTDETPQRLLTVAAWRDSPFFTDAERAALALTEAVTRIADDGVPDTVWDDAKKHFDERQLAALVLHVAVVNVWNRLNVATRQVAGTGW
ncbi:MAG: carboxymuconolactone decarboxylase family protein [Deltaproteobacteria bacterium]|nr:carboxymuconolactone decarboxylase family protein [Deltaproteobacteria bacterium]